MKDLESSLSMPLEQQVPFQQNINDEILKLEITIKEQKLRKYRRDQEDYQRGQVYRWDRPSRTPRSSRSGLPDQQQQHSRTVSFNLTSSEDERDSKLSMDRGSTASTVRASFWRAIGPVSHPPELPATQDAPREEEMLNAYRADRH